MKTVNIENNMIISNALEDYLKAIYQLSRKKPTVRITDIATHLGISKPSVNRAVNTLKTQGLVFHEPYGDIMLTPAGEKLGNAFCYKHNMIKKFLTHVLHVPDDQADDEARSMGHTISLTTVERMAKYMDQ